MKIALDYAFTLAGGVIPYFQEMMRHLPSTDMVNEYLILITRQGEDMVKDLLPAPNIHYLRIEKTISSKYRLYWEQVCLPTLLERYGIDVLFSFNNCVPLRRTRFKKVMLLGTLGPFYDEFIDYHDFFSRKELKLLKKLVVASMKASDITVFESHFTADLIKNKYGFKGRYVVNHHGRFEVNLADLTEESVTRVTNKFGIRKDYFLYVSYVRKYKNLDRLIDAYASTKGKMQKEVDFIVAGSSFPEGYVNSLVAKCRTKGIGDSFHFIGMVDRATDLGSLMAGCYAYMFPSKYENLSYALIEALSHGLPILTSTGTAMPETCGDAALYYDPEDTQGMADCMLRVVNEPGLATSLRQKARERAPLFRLPKDDILFNLEICKMALSKEILPRIKSNQERQPDKHISSYRLGIDASNIRTGGGLTHLSQLLAFARPCEFGIGSVVVWGGRQTLKSLPEKDWLEKIHVTSLDGALPMRIFWQQLMLRRCLKKNHCDIIFSPGGTLPLRIPIPSVVMSQNLLPFERGEARRFALGSFMRTKMSLLQRSQSSSMKRADGLIFLSKYARDTVLPVLGNIRGMTTIIPHGVEERFFKEPDPARPFSMYTRTNPFKILYVSHIDVYKHQWHVVKAISMLRDEGMPIEVNFVGGAYRPAMKILQKMVAAVDSKGEFVRLGGLRPHDKMHLEYSRADAFVFASSCENMPNILLEAMAAGLPIACSNRGPMPEVIGESAVYFDPEKPREIEQALKTLVEDEQLRSRLAAEANKKAKAYSWQRCADETFAFIARIANK